jgi:cell wall-associated NlpC family hydrolase
VLGSFTAGVILASALVSVMSSGASAGADPIAVKRAEAAALAQKIDAQGRQIQVLSEQFNGARLHAQVVDQQLGTAQQNLGLAQAQESRAKAELGRQAVEAYMHGGYLSPPSTSPMSGHVDLAVQKGYFQLATNNESDALDRMRTAERNLSEQRVALLTAQQEARNAVTALAGRQKAVSQAAAADKATLNQVTGELAKLVAEQQAKLEAERIAQQQAALAAQLARERAQAQAAAAAAATARANQIAAAAAPRAAASGGGSGLASGVRTPTPQAPAPSPPPRAGPAVPPGSSRGLTALAFARAQLGKPYEWGAAGPGTYDCSGLTMRAWEAAGVGLPHFAAAQYAQIAHVPIAALQPGDLVFFGSDLHHVGIYAGGGQMIDAPYTGTVVRYDSIFWGDLIGAGRPG